MASVDSASDDRTVNNTMRHKYRVLSDAEKANMQSIKDAGLAFHDQISGLGNSREISLAKTKVEEAVMWAVKHITSALIITLGVGAGLVGTHPAFAQMTNQVSAQPFVSDFAAYLAAIIGGAVPVILGLIFAEVKKMTGLSISSDLQSQIATWATTEAEALAANIEGNLGSRSFTVGSPEVAAILNAAPAEILKILTDLGLTTDDLAKMVVAAIGRLQQNALVVVTSTPTK
jgi:hypothetical protein